MKPTNYELLFMENREFKQACLVLGNENMGSTPDNRINVWKSQNRLQNQYIDSQLLSITL